MKLDARVSNRDKSLLVFLIVILILFAAYYFFFQPQLDRLLLTKSGLEQAQSELSGIDQQIATLPDLKTKEAELLTQINAKVAPFFYELKDDRLLNHFNTLMAQTGFKMQSYTVTPAALAQIVPPFYNEQAVAYPVLDAAAKVNPDLQNSDAANPAPSDASSGSSDQTAVGSEEAPSDTDALASNSLLLSSITVSFIDTTYESVIGFLKAVEALNKAIVISNISVTAQQVSDLGLSGTLQGQIQLDLYSLAKPDNSEKDFLSFYNSFPQGKGNPFN